MKTRRGALWTITRTLVFPVTIALVTTVFGVAQSPKSSPSSRSTRPTKSPQPSAAPKQTAKAPAAEDANPPTGWTRKTGEGQPDFQGFWSTSSPVPTSMITGTEGGIPPLSEEGLKRQAELTAKQAAMRGHEFGQTGQTLTERCIVSNSEGLPVLASENNSNLQIVQGKGYVVILQEMGRDARLIPLDDRPHLDSNVAQWFGDSRGRWEGDTLVVETTNFSGRQGISSDKLKVTERFTRLNEASLQYEFTIDDPVWTRPWTTVVSWARTEGPLLEYACHEGNYGSARP